MNTIFYTYAEFTCTECGNKLWSKDEQEILDFIQLYDAEKLICPVCGNNKFKVSVRGNGGRGMPSSTSPPLFFSITSPCLRLSPDTMRKAWKRLLMKSSE